MTDGSGLREAAQEWADLCNDHDLNERGQAVMARLRAALSGESGEPKVCPRCGRWDSHDHAVPVGESDASLRDALTDWPKFSHGVRVRTVIDMENEGVVTWGDDRHRERFLAE